MKSRHVLTLAAVLALALTALAGAATAVGPWPGLAASITASDGVRYSAKPFGLTTKVSRQEGTMVHTVRLKGAFGIPAVTFNGVAGGLSADEKTLVLAEPMNGQSLKTRSRFLILSTSTLKVVHSIRLQGSFGFDALSPDHRTLYLIQQQSASNPKYAVRAYDLVHDRLLTRVIVDKRTPGEKMNGYPIARTESSDANWVYTLYRKQNNETFVHALNSNARYALCIDFHWPGNVDGIWQGSLSLDQSGSLLTVKMADGSVAAKIDTQAFKVVP